jgi:soluble lytic murein transglycosylase-like protein
VFAILFLSMGTSLSPAWADVLAIGDDGAVTVNAGPAIYTSSDLRPEPIISNVTSIAPNQHRKQQHSATPNDPVVREAIDVAANRYSVSPALISAIAWRESDFNAAAQSAKGAKGIMQLMPATALTFCPHECSTSSNVNAGVAYFSDLLERYNGDIPRALAAYNAGPGAVDRFGGVPPYRETQAYVAAILERLSANALSATN